MRVTLQDPLIHVEGQFLKNFHNFRRRIAHKNAGFLRDQVAHLLWSDTTASDSQPRRIVGTQRRSSARRIRVIGVQHIPQSSIGNSNRVSEPRRRPPHKSSWPTVVRCVSILRDERSSMSVAACLAEESVFTANPSSRMTQSPRESCAPFYQKWHSP